MTEKVTIGIIGAGRIGQLHADNALRSGLIELKTIADIYTEHLDGTVYEKSVPIITTNPDELIIDPEIDAILICSSTDTHTEYIIKAAEAGKHIFCEKPISFNIEDTKTALEVVKKEGVKFQVGFNRRFDRHFRKVYETVRSGKIGEPHVIKVTSRDPEAPPEEYIQRSGGMFMDMTIHDFDMIRYLVGQNVTEISVQATCLVDEKFSRNDDVDTAVITLTFEDGSLGVIDNSRQAVYGYDQRIEVFGNAGVVSAENEPTTNVHISTKETVTLDNPKYFFLERYQDAYVEELDAFARSILEDSPLICSGEDGLQAELLAIAAKTSLKEKRAVKLSEFQMITS
ncbi:inositol 2-dehydrogenase [Alkalihalobacillus sp. TS-13]|uniref:inositol 2-dehydrogenase n=1 Tax=Alkalihalobacillus sp. TS-13 TaxID=2842455 RepID=UPI001C879F44|nr:inositol 2-dehydrogenase [Alkalihalobacillus sp. TS-13]